MAKVDVPVTKSWLGLLPAGLFLGIFLLFPVGAIFYHSFFDPTFTWRHYQHLLTEPVYMHILLTTFKIAFLVTLITLALGYPVAYVLHRVTGKAKMVILMIVLLPFWTSLLVRTFAFLMLLQREGIINHLLQKLRLIQEPIQMVHNLTGVLIGMSYVLLPYMILSIYGTLSKIDPLLEKMAIGLGASRFKAFLSTLFPLSLPGVFVGSALVFLLSLGFFVTPALLGGPKEQMLAMAISSEVTETLNWGFGGALSFFLIAATALFGVSFAGIARTLNYHLSK